ncbi:AbiTii domain-containing protein [Yinghuangia soli]|uniref:AbiTii domain-containing protein n=1 Tax=Yinghuangia soli TaxID=2908204 RepID=A0AA41PVS1_9ACTN|nr:hypothetical protein [Yinghuangia soli]MCF2526601.1 hypothetical protein [Yinghuangia soli]
MALLQDIIIEAAGESTSTASLLRKARVLATRLGITEALTWIGHELNGYTGEVPEYRGPIPCEVRGKFLGPFNSSLSNVQVATELLPARFRDLDKIFLRQSVSAIEDLAARSGDGMLSSPWPGAAVASFNAGQEAGEFTLYPDMGAIAIWNSVPPSEMKAVVDAVRTRVLDFALKLEQEDPEAGEKAGDSLVTAEKGNDIFNTIINGPANVAQGSSNFTQNSFVNTPKSDEELVQHLRDLGVNEDLLTELSEALAGDRAEAPDAASAGPRVQGWLGRIMSLGRTSATAVGTGVATNVVTDTVLSYFG